jgi:hypothetical protein
MSSENERIAWLHQHLNYELLMMRHTYKQLQALPETAKDHLVWNANIGAFAVYARNLCSFLTNDPDSRSFKASDYERPKTDGQPVQGIMNNLHEQIFHPGKQRINASKVGLEKAKRLYEWVELSMRKFLNDLREPYKSAWKEEMANPTLYDTLELVLALEQDTASSHPGAGL